MSEFPSFLPPGICDVELIKNLQTRIAYVIQWAWPPGHHMLGQTRNGTLATAAEM